MGRIRTIKPEFWQNEALCSLPEAVHLLAAALLNYADDEGFFNANPKLVEAACFPLREPSVSVHRGLTDLSNIGYIRLGRSRDGREYGHIISFKKHQKVNRPTPSKISGLAIDWDGGPLPHGGLSEDSLPEQGTGNREQGRERNGASAIAAAPAQPPQPRAEQVDPESWTDDRLWEEVLTAVGLRGPGIPTYWQAPGGIRHVARWHHQLGIPHLRIVAEARASRANHEEPPSGPKALDGVMKRLAADLKAEPMQAETAPRERRNGQDHTETPEQRRARWARMASRVSEPAAKAGGAS